MKRVKLYLIITFCCLWSVSIAQDLPVDQNTGKITYIEVVDAAGLSTKDLYETVKKWGAAQKFTIKEDKANESILFDCTSSIEYPNVNLGGNDKGKVSFTCFVFVKDGKYRYIFTDFTHQGDGKTADASGGKLENVSPECGKTKMSAKGWVTVKSKTDANTKALVEDLRRVIKEAQNDPAKKSDW